MNDLARLCTALLLAANPLAAQATSEPEVPVIVVSGKVNSQLRDYRHYYPGLVQYEKKRALSPLTQLRFAMATSAIPRKPVPIVRASLESKSWNLTLPVDEEGWFTIPVSEEALDRDAKVVVSRRNAGVAMWVLDIHTAGLPWNVFRLGDLRLLCHVYIAIDWARNERAGRILPNSMGLPPDKACDGPQMIYFHSTDMPRLKGYRITEQGERISYLLSGKSMPNFINIGKERGAWSPDALVEFILPDGSHWKAEAPAE